MEDMISPGKDCAGEQKVKKTKKKKEKNLDILPQSSTPKGCPPLMQLNQVQGTISTMKHIRVHFFFARL
jgi:hypothetical protein